MNLLHLVLWIKVGPPIWPARSHMRNAFDRGVSWTCVSHSPDGGKIFERALIPELRYAAFKFWKTVHFSFKIILDWLYFAVWSTSQSTKYVIFQGKANIEGGNCRNWFICNIDHSGFLILQAKNEVGRWPTRFWKKPTPGSQLFLLAYRLSVSQFESFSVNKWPARVLICFVIWGEASIFKCF